MRLACAVLSLYCDVVPAVLRYCKSVALVAELSINFPAVRDLHLSLSTAVVIMSRHLDRAAITVDLELLTVAGTLLKQ